MTRLLTAVLIMLLAIPVAGSPDLTSAQASDTEVLGGSTADVNCDNFVSQADAQAVYLAAIESDGSDIYGLDDGPTPNEEACDGERTELDGPVLASCADLRDQSHAEALFAAGGADDPYNLDANGNDIPCDSGTAPTDAEPLDAEPIPSDLPPTNEPEPAPLATVDVPEGCDVNVQAGRAYVITDCDDGHVEAGFLPFAGFDDFAARAENGFGAFDDTESSASTTAPTVEVQQSLPATGATNGASQGAADSETRVVESEQTARKAKAKKRAKAAKLRKAKKRAKLKRARQKAERERIRSQQRSHRESTERP